MIWFFIAFAVLLLVSQVPLYRRNSKVTMERRPPC
jgi:hypothetical protein